MQLKQPTKQRGWQRPTRRGQALDLISAIVWDYLMEVCRAAPPGVRFQQAAHRFYHCVAAMPGAFTREVKLEWSKLREVVGATRDTMVKAVAILEEHGLLVRTSPKTIRLLLPNYAVAAFDNDRHTHPHWNNRKGRMTADEALALVGDGFDNYLLNERPFGDGLPWLVRQQNH